MIQTAVHVAGDGFDLVACSVKGLLLSLIVARKDVRENPASSKAIFIGAAMYP
jgi:hypothetical protein